MNLQRFVLLVATILLTFAVLALGQTQTPDTSTVTHIVSDTEGDIAVWVLSIGIPLVLTVIGILWKYINYRENKVRQEVEDHHDHEHRISTLERLVKHDLMPKLDKILTKLDNLTTRVVKLESRMDKVEHTIAARNGNERRTNDRLGEILDVLKRGKD